MYRKGNLYYADWRTPEGVRKRKAFKTEVGARRHETRIRNLRPLQGRTVAYSCALILARPSNYRSRVTIARLFKSTHGDVPLIELTAGHVQSIQDRYARASRATQYAYNQQLRWLLKAFETEGAPNLQFAVTRTPRSEARVVQPTADELQLLISTPDLTLRFVILCAAECGLRFRTACAVRPCDVQRGKIRRHTKWGQLADVPVSERLAAVMAAVPPGTSSSSEERYIDLLEGRPLRAFNTTIHNRWCKWKKQVGIKRDLRLHDLRRGLARSVYAITKDLRSVQSVLGHKQLTSTLQYLHAYVPVLPKDVLQQAIERERTI